MLLASVYWCRKWWGVGGISGEGRGSIVWDFKGIMKWPPPPEKDQPMWDSVRLFTFKEQPTEPKGSQQPLVLGLRSRYQSSDFPVLLNLSRPQVPSLWNGRDMDRLWQPEGWSPTTSPPSSLWTQWLSPPTASKRDCADVIEWNIVRWGDELGLSKRVLDVITNTTTKGDLTQKSRPSEDRRFREGRC